MEEKSGVLRLAKPKLRGLPGLLFSRLPFIVLMIVLQLLLMAGVYLRLSEYIPHFLALQSLFTLAMVFYLSTAEIHVANAALVSNLSEGVCIEGVNSIELTNCDLTANNTKCNGNATFLDAIMIYQSMSGDADSGTSSFTMTDGSLTSKSGHVFHVTNTNAVITLRNVRIVNEDGDGILLSVCADGWSGGSNTATLNAAAQVLTGAIKVGSDSELTLSLTEESSFAGSIDGSIVNASGASVSTGVGTVSVTLDSTSTWTLTGDSYVTAFNGDASCVISNGYTLYVNGVALTGVK